MNLRKNRRAVFAELLLTTSPIKMGQRPDGTSLDVEFATIPELRAWLESTGLDTPDLLTGESTNVMPMPDGRPFHEMRAYPTWHGWKIFARATEYTDPAPLDADTRDRLSDLAVA